MAKKDMTTDAAREKDREKWMACLQVRLAMQPGMARTVVLQAVKDVTARARRHDAVVDALDSVGKRAGDVTGL
ncbi:MULTISPECIES: hypothetical protein [unclassified Streptomyces]|uniref:hypothetical protein n=1 Tax=unclassified Streptomyces TaxID=2593676 RepID=UPI002DD914A7|nr:MULTISPECIES: hypothetical protein [unclassified Streptomyces]WSC34196.1 hypothetical protein OHA08_00615 [Streptomyces sp. NBC_01763]WSC41862.1 hypothetical protein OHA08_44365 [Streptomyces sp. NBC_01763]